MVERKTQRHRWLLPTLAILVMLGWLAWYGVGNHAEPAQINDNGAQTSNETSDGSATAGTQPANVAATDAATTHATADQEDAIACRDTNETTEHILRYMDRQIGPEMAALRNSNAFALSEQDKPDIQPSWEASDGGVKTLSPHSSYANELLQAAARNGDAMSAAVYGARLLNMVQRAQVDDNNSGSLQQQLGESERYLRQGLAGNISGTLMFMQQLMQERIKDTRRQIAAGKLDDAVLQMQLIDAYAWQLAQQRLGSFNERLMAYSMLRQQNSEPTLPNELLPQAEATAARIVADYAHNQPPRSKEEAAAEHAAMAFIDKMLLTESRFEKLRCEDGKTVDAQAMQNAMQKLAERYRHD